MKEYKFLKALLFIIMDFGDYVGNKLSKAKIFYFRNRNLEKTLYVSEVII